MKISHLSAAFEGTGAASAATRIHAHSIRTGLESRMWVAQRGSSDPYIRFAPIPGGFVGRLRDRLQKEIEERLLKQAQSRSDYVLSTGRFGRDAWKVVAGDRPQLVHLHWIAGGSFQLESLAKIPTPIVWRLPDMWPFCGVEHLLEDSRRFVEGFRKDNRPDGEVGWDVSRWTWLRKRGTYAKIQNLTLVAPSNWMAACIKKSALLGNRRIEVIKTGCDTDVFKPRGQLACRTVLDFPLDRRLILAGATCLRTRWKGGDLLVDSINRLSEISRTPFELVLFGASADEIARNVRCPVRSLGKIKEERMMAALYGSADVFVAPSRMENMANTVLEAMSCGTPCAAFRIGGMPDMIDSGINGWLCDPFNTQELTVSLKEAIEAPSPERGERARKRMLADFTLEQQGRQYEELYRRLLDGPLP